MNCFKQKLTDNTPIEYGTAEELNSINRIHAVTTAFTGLIISLLAGVGLAFKLAHGSSVSIGCILGLLVCAVIFSVSFILTIPSKRKVKPIVSYIVYTAFLLLCCAVSLHAGFADIPAFGFCGAVVFCSCLFVFKPNIHISLIISAFVVYYFFLCANNTANHVSLPAYICTCLVCVFCACLRYKAVTGKVKAVAALAEENRRLKAMVGLDYLTDTKNRYALEQDKTKYLNKPVCVIMCDIDCFKLFNDTYGHQAGDRVISKAADILKRYFGREHTYRYGGDEFLIISHDDNCEKLLKSICSDISDIQIEGINRPIEFSFGVASGEVTDSDSLDKLIFTADKLLYENK